MGAVFFGGGFQTMGSNDSSYSNTTHIPRATSRDFAFGVLLLFDCEKKHFNLELSRLHNNNRRHVLAG